MNVMMGFFHLFEYGMLDLQNFSVTFHFISLLVLDLAYSIEGVLSS